MNQPTETSFGPVRFLPGPNKGKYPHCHSLYIEGSKILIDPASDRQRLKRLRDEEGVNQIWLTHWHEDHIAHLDLFEDLPIHIHELDQGPITDLELFLEGYPYGGKPDIREYWRKTMLEQFHYKPRKIAGHLHDGQVIELPEVTVEVIHTPGHTPGHLSFFFREPGVLFMGDYDLTPFGPWYGDVLSDIDQTIESVEKLSKVPAKVWMACHETGLFTEQPGQLWDDFLAVVQRRDQGLRQLLARPTTLQQIVDARFVYGRPREPKEFFDMGELAIMDKHLQRLMAKGLVKAQNGHFRLA